MDTWAVFHLFATVSKVTVDTHTFWGRSLLSLGHGLRHGGLSRVAAATTMRSCKTVAQTGRFTYFCARNVRGGHVPWVRAHAHCQIFSWPAQGRCKVQYPTVAFA